MAFETVVLIWLAIKQLFLISSKSGLQYMDGFRKRNSAKNEWEANQVHCKSMTRTSLS